MTTKRLPDTQHFQPAPGTQRPSTRFSPRGLLVARDTVPGPVALVAFSLLLGIGLVHIQDQGGFIGDVMPLYMAVGYYVVEIGAAAAIPLVLRHQLSGWLLAAMISIGPFVAYLLSRTVGLPGDAGDVGNWGYTLGSVSLALEGTLFILSVACVVRAASTRWPRPARIA